MNTEWHNDYGHPAYPNGLIVNAPEGKRDISEWAKRQIHYNYWLCFRAGNEEYNARTFHSMEKLKTLKHGDTLKLSDGKKYQFIVEKL